MLPALPYLLSRGRGWKETLPPQRLRGLAFGPLLLGDVPPVAGRTAALRDLLWGEARRRLLRGLGPVRTNRACATPAEGLHVAQKEIDENP